MNIKINKGFDINLAGKAKQQLGEVAMPETFAIKPTDFVGMYRPKLLAREGDVVKAGDPLFFDKQLPEVKYTAPVSGELVEIKRGAKRKILEFKILADKTMEYREFKRYTASELSGLKREDILPSILESGAWLNVIQRPYGIVANPADTPKALFISAFDSHPLAPDYSFIFKGQEKYLQAGIDLMKKVANCPIHLTIDAAGEVSNVFNNLNGITQHQIKGQHPAGNVGVQIHHIQPINKEEVVWTMNPYGLIQIGKLFLEGKYDASKVIALAGSEVAEPQYYKTYTGACFNKLKSKVSGSHVRVISGNVLTGERIAEDGYLGFYDHLVTVIPEGDKPRFFLTDGWLAPVKNRLSFHRAMGLFSFLNPKSKEYTLDSSLNGEDRAFVLTGAFEKVVPMDVLPTHLIKAIMAEDYEDMESLGIYEVVEEDLALCEFIDVSKHPIQRILREGLDLMRLG